MTRLHKLSITRQQHTDKEQEQRLLVQHMNVIVGFNVGDGFAQLGHTDALDAVLMLLIRCFVVTTSANTLSLSTKQELDVEMDFWIHPANSFDVPMIHVGAAFPVHTAMHTAPRTTRSCLLSAAPAL